MKIYLSGPMTGLTHDVANDWRKEFNYQLNKRQKTTQFINLDYIHCVSPMRGKRFLCDGIIEATPKSHELETPQGVIARDYFDCSRSDIILANVLGAKRVSIGTCFEMAWFMHWRKPVILVMEDLDNVHEHCFVTQAAGFRVNSLEKAMDLVLNML